MSYDPGAHGGPHTPGGPGWPGGQQYPGGYGQPPPQQQPGWGPPGPGPADGPQGQFGPAQPTGLAALFDFSFASFATPSLIRLVYIVGTVLIGLSYLGSVITYFVLSPVAGLIALLFGAVFALFGLAMLRVVLEFFYAVVRMSEEAHNRR